MPLSATFEIRSMQQDDYDQVFSLLQNSFFKDEPITRHIQLTETTELAKYIMQSCIQDRCSFVASDTETKQIVGVALNEIVQRDHPQGVEQTDEKIRFVFEIFDAAHQRRHVFEEFNADRLLHVYVISVDQIARGHRLAARLIEGSIQYAKELHLPGAFAEATNLISLKCFKQQQFEVLDELIYAQYDPERLAKLNTETADRCYLVARKL